MLFVGDIGWIEHHCCIRDECKVSANLVRVGEEAARFLRTVDRAETMRPLREYLFKRPIVLQFKSRESKCGLVDFPLTWRIFLTYMPL